MAFLVEHCFSNLGLEKLWFSDKVNYCAVSENLAVRACGADSLIVGVTGSDSWQVHELIHTVENMYRMFEEAKKQVGFNTPEWCNIFEEHRDNKKPV